MRLVSLFLAGVCALALLIQPAAAHAATPQAKGASARDTKAIEENMALDKRFFAAFNARDVDAITATYWNSPDVVSVDFDGTLTKGIDGVRAGWASLFGSTDSIHIEQLESNYSMLGDAVFGYGKASMTLNFKGGTSQTVVLRYADVRRKVSNQWFYTFDSVVKIASESNANESLYKRLGGYDACAAVCDEFLKRLAANPKLNHFLGGLSASSLQRLRQLLVDQVCYATGGPCLYVGRDMKTAHKGLGITSADWDAAAADLAASLDALNVPAREKGEFLAFVVTLKPDIVEK
ncbi:MAG TPA: nuclear transport factor 2 family protein [Blastocatellia bacterium]|nr:nuclear transport factor 2 family protein [Blastocatellia bacterium]